MEETIEKQACLIQEGSTLYDHDVHKFKQELDKMFELYKAKNFDYDNSFEKSCNEFGLISPIIRLSDKLNRIKSLYNKDYISQVTSEKLEDTLIDLANYSIMTLLWIKKLNDISGN